MRKYAFVIAANHYLKFKPKFKIIHEGINFDNDFIFAVRENFAALLEELRTEFDKSGSLLTAAVPAANFRINEGYDVPRITRALDLINVMTYDMRGAWDGRADHHAPMNVRCEASSK